jgi:2-oxoisovalerate ferredoxin oxidoreductase beta subunit
VSVFYERFERHDHAQGLKGKTTHYCPGCGHGLVQNYLGAAIEKLGIQDRTIAVAPVGCGVFLYYYLDVGNTQAAHGRASAVAVGHKLANPEAIVVAYQGDGDLAAIGLTEAVHAAALGIPISVLFVNNAIYGMTGGQLAPTSIPGMKTATSPRGRDRAMGSPLKMAEMIAQLDAPVYVERVALFDAKQRVRASRAIEKSLRLQMEGRGFSFVEILSECPTHLGMTPAAAEAWVREKMLPVFPLGVKKDATAEPWTWPVPAFDPEPLLREIGARAEPPPRFAAGFPGALFGGEIGLKLAGAGGDGAQTAAMLLARAAIAEGFDATHIPSYGPESRGGTSFADVRLAEDAVLSPDVAAPHVLVAFNAPSLARFGPSVLPGGVALYDSTAIREPPALAGSVRVIPVPCSEIAHELGQPKVKSAVALGALHAAVPLMPEETFLAAIRAALGGKAALVAVNEEAFRRGVQAARAVTSRT